MDQAALVEIVRQALVAGLLVVAPALGAAVLVGLVTGLVQGATGIHEPILGFVPRLVAVAVMILVSLPWMVERLAELLRTAAAGS